VDCPNCKLINPPDTEWCDCGYNFNTQSVRYCRDKTPKLERAIEGFFTGFASGVSSAREKHSDRMICPHCQERGHVTTRTVWLKKGISGGKAVGAIVTLGWSLLATGLSRKEEATEARCSNCGSVWHF
jgi:hypothetical protein